MVKKHISKGKIKTACVIQGNVRTNFEFVILEMQKQFDVVIISTWDNERSKMPSGDFFIEYSKKPKVPGFSHRNFQRYSTARGIEKARELGCNYVLKWRTDFLPTRLDLKYLFDCTNYNIPEGFSSRLVMPAFRNLTVENDWFSSIPDLFAFGHIDEMEMLWSDYQFDYEKAYNPPPSMIKDCSTVILERMNIEADWCAESELYAIYKYRLSEKIAQLKNHASIAREFLNLIDYRNLGIVWFASDGGYRTIYSGCGHDWWSRSRWRSGTPVKAVPLGYKKRKLSNWLIGKLIQQLEKAEQPKNFISWKKRNVSVK